MSNRAANKGPARRGGNVKRGEEAVKKKAQELHDSGMPYQMAMAVAHGKLTLNDALERMARRDRVHKLMERHDLSRALATQIAIGHADLDQVLARRRCDAHRAENRDRTCLEPSEAPIALALQGDAKIAQGRVLELHAYTFLFQRKGQDEGEEIHKLRAKYSYVPSDWKVVKKALKVDRKVAQQAEPPPVRPQDRYSCSDKRLFGFMDRGIEIAVTLLDGEILRGHLEWFGRYEFGLRVKGDAVVTVFRHALRDVSPA